MKKVGSFFIVMLCVCSLVFIAVSSGTANAAEKVFKWDFLLSLPQNHARNVGLHKLIANVDKRTQGHLKITAYSAGELPYTGNEAIQIASDGTVQMADANCANIGGSSQAGPVVTYPFLCSSWDKFRRMVEAITPHFVAEVKEKNIHTLFFMPDPLQYMFGQREVIKTWDDMKGRSMRGQNSYMQQFASLVGANSIAIVSNEIPTAINKGVIDSFVTASLSVTAGSFYEFINWTLCIPYSVNGSFILVNQDAWDSLPAEYRKIVEEEGAALVKYYWESYIDEVDKVALKQIADAKVTVYENNPALVESGKAIIQPYHSQWAKEAGKYAVKALEDATKAMN